MRLPGLTIGILAAIITVAERRMMDLVADELGVVPPSVVQKRTQRQPQTVGQSASIFLPSRIFNSAERGSN
jgi:hypothetical protein